MHRGTSLLQWAGVNVDRCVADGGWNGPRETSGSEPTGSLLMDTNFVLEHQGPDGLTIGIAMITVFDSNLPPAVTLTASPTWPRAIWATMVTWIFRVQTGS